MGRIKDFLKMLGGKWNRALAGWTFPGNKHSQLTSGLRSHGAQVDDDINGASDYIQVTDTIRTSSISFRGKLGIDVRKFQRGKDGQVHPTVKGIRFSRNEWAQLCQETKAIDAACGSEHDSQLELSNNLRVSVKSLNENSQKCVDIRRFYDVEDDGTHTPSKKGIWLSQTDWSALKRAMQQLTVACVIPAESAETAWQTTAM